MSFTPQAEAARRRILKPLQFKMYLLAKLPLAACAGLALERLDEETCAVTLPGGWRTQNPFRSTYFAAQLMAAEMSTGAAAMVLTEGASVSVAMLLREAQAVYTKRIQGASRYVFSGVAEMRAVVERAAESGESESYTAHSVGHAPDGTAASEFRLTWSFKRRK